VGTCDRASISSKISSASWLFIFVCHIRLQAYWHAPYLNSTARWRSLQKPHSMYRKEGDQARRTPVKSMAAYASRTVAAAALLMFCS
jgi:hypothetical protein